MTVTTIANLRSALALREPLSGVALFTAMHAYQVAKEGEFSLSFLPPEPRLQKDARRRPDKDQWLATEDKELDTLWKMEAFEVVNLPDDYDPLPLQFVYKLKVKDGDFDNCMCKARLVTRGDLQYVTEHGSTYDPTARLFSDHQSTHSHGCPARLHAQEVQPDWRFPGSLHGQASLR
jgi:hypothetical protein